jgi:hypothetical protein
MKRQSLTQKMTMLHFHTIRTPHHTLEDHIDPKNQKTQHKKITYMQ